VQIQSRWQALSSLKGVRVNCNVEILHNGDMFAQSRGELQFTEQGLSGPVIFEISRDVCSASGSWIARLDFMPQWNEDKLMAHLQNRMQTNYPIDELLTGVLHNRLGRVLTQCAGIKGKAYCKDLSQRELEELCRYVKALEVELTEPMGMENAQVTAGGVLTDDFDPYTLESKKIPGLFVCGELLDVDGDCGGYNLQWAWSSGCVAGRNAGRDTK
jgi:predicted Rossmann fold flavoprotein